MRIDIRHAEGEEFEAELQNDGRSFVEVKADRDSTTVTVGKVDVVITRMHAVVLVDDVRLADTTIE